MSPGADRNLLFGLLALQMDFLTREQLIDGFQLWMVQKDTPIGAVLLQRGTLQAEDIAAVEVLVRRRLERHGGDVQASLAGLRVQTPVREELSRLDDEVQASLSTCGRGGDSAGADSPRSSATMRYQRLRAHARGGLGEVSVALDTELHREVALKEIQEHYADLPEARARFVCEAEVTGNLEHPGIVPIYGLGAYPDGRPYYAMRFIRGESLHDAVKRHHEADKSELALRKLLTRFVAVYNAAAFPHSRGVIHRDLKPANVMLGDYGETLVVDWGLARVMAQEEDATTPPGWVRSSAGGDSTPTEQGQAVGTPAYMPPEQARGHRERVGSASDIFSLGATLYHLLTGQAPYGGSEALLQAAACEWKPVRQVKRAVPRALEAICARAMAAEPAQRYGTARELGEEIERWLGDLPVAAHREPWRDRARRWGRKHRTLVSSAVAVLLVGVIALGGGLAAVGAEQRQTARERDRAIDAEEKAEGNLARARAAEKQAKGNLKKAEANLTLAKKAVNDTFDLAKTHLLNQENMRAVRKLLLEKALPFYKNFRTQSPNDTEAQRELADQLFRVGYITDEIANKTEAGKAYQQAAQIYRTLLKDHPGVTAYRTGLAQALNNMGILLQKEGKGAEALKAHTQARDLREKLVKEHPGVTPYRTEFARACGARGTLLLHSGKAGEALADFDEALKHLLLVRKRDPRSVEAKQLLWVGSYYRARTLDQLKRHRDAVADWDRAVELAPTVNRLVLRKGRALCLARAGQYVRAIAEADQLSKLGRPPGKVLYDLACIAALGGAAANTDLARPLPWREHLAQGAARQAMTWLLAAHKAGFFKNAANRQHMTKDTDLDSLRTRADFKAFVASLRPKNDK